MAMLFALHGRVTFFIRIKKVTKEIRPIVLAFGYSARFSLDRARRTRCAQTSTELFRPSLPVLDNPKGDGRSKARSKIKNGMVLERRST